METTRTVCGEAKLPRRSRQHPCRRGATVISIIELGALGEFLGSIGVIATLIYLAIQIRQNTHSMDEGRKLALAGTYQSRVETTSASSRLLADSESLAAINVKVRDAGWPSGSDSLDVLTPVERQRWMAYNETIILNVENLSYQYEQGLLDAELYESNVRNTITRLGLGWKAFGLLNRFGRPSFRRDVDRILSESEAESEENEP